MAQPTSLLPPIIVSEKSGVVFSLESVEAVIDYVRRHPELNNWEALRETAFIAAAVPSAENVAALRALALQAFAAVKRLNPYAEAGQREAWARGYACYEHQDESCNRAFSTLWAELPEALRAAAADGWTSAVADGGQEPRPGLAFPTA
jgi:hypothetical protein